MLNINIGELIELMKKRGNVTRFKRDSLNPEDLEKILEAARWAPSAGNAQPWELIVIEDFETKKEISRIHSAAMGSMEEEEYPKNYLHPAVLIAVCLDSRVKDKYPGLFSTEFLLNASLGAMIQNMWLAVSSLNLGMGMGSQPLSAQDELRELLDVPEYLWIPEIIQIGYPAEEITETSRRETREFIHREKLDRSKLKRDE